MKEAAKAKNRKEVKKLEDLRRRLDKKVPYGPPGEWDRNVKLFT